MPRGPVAAKDLDAPLPTYTRAPKRPRPAERTWTAGELIAELRHVDPDTEVFLVGPGQIERVAGFGSTLRARAMPVLRRVFGVRVRRPDGTRLVAYIEGKPTP